MYEFVPQGCFENSPAFQYREWLKFDAVIAGRGCRPCRHAGAAHEVAGRFIDKYLDLRELKFNTRCRQPMCKHVPARLEQVDHTFRFPGIVCRKVDVKMRSASLSKVCRVRLWPKARARKILRQDLTETVAALCHFMRSFLA